MTNHPDSSGEGATHSQFRASKPEIVRIIILIVTFGLWPIIAFAAVNVGQGTELHRLALFALANLVVAIVFLTPLHLVFRDRVGVRAYYLYPLFIISFYFFGDIMNAMDSLGLTRFRYRVPVYLFLFIVAAYLVFKGARNEKFRTVVVSVGVTMFLLAGADYAYTAAQAYQGDLAKAAPTGTSALKQSKVLARIPKPDFLSSPPPASTFRPNIYYLLPDGHVSPHVLRSEMGFDPKEFVSTLTELGLKVYDRTWSNYPATRTSVSSTMSMQYLFRPDNEAEKAEIHNIDPNIILGENRVLEALVERGYTYVHIPNGFITLWNCGPYVDHCIKKPEGFLDVSETDLTLLSRTPVPLIVQQVFRTFVWAGRITEFTDFAKMLPVDVKPPFFLMFHTMAPHSPYRFTAECESRPVFQDISEALYLEQLKCIDKHIAQAVERIVETDPEAIIVLQSDHGFWTQEQNITPMLDWTERRKRITMSSLGAYRLPARCQHLLPEEMSQVNAFRIVLGCIDGDEKPLLENRHYLPIWVYHPKAANETYEWVPETGEIK